MQYLQSGLQVTLLRIFHSIDRATYKNKKLFFSEKIFLYGFRRRYKLYILVVYAWCIYNKEFLCALSFQKKKIKNDQKIRLGRRWTFCCSRSSFHSGRLHFGQLLVIHVKVQKSLLCRGKLALNKVLRKYCPKPISTTNKNFRQTLAARINTRQHMWL